MEFEEVAEIVLMVSREISGIDHVSLDDTYELPLHKGGMGLDYLDHLALLMRIEEILDLDLEERVYRTPREVAKYVHSLNPTRRTTAWEPVKERLHFTYNTPWDQMPPAKE